MICSSVPFYVRAKTSVQKVDDGILPWWFNASIKEELARLAIL